MIGTRLRERRALPRLRRLAKRALVWWDVQRHRHDPSLAPWISVLAGTRAGHVVVPSTAIVSSRADAADFVAHDLVRPGARVLDVGSGNGRQAIGLVELGVAEYVGLDVVWASVERCNEAFAGVGNVGFDWLDVRNDMYNPGGRMPPELVRFPYDEGSFDFVVAGSLFTHLERLEVAARYLDEIARVLRPAGRAFVTFFRSPPNEPSSSAVRTVFAQADIEAIVPSALEVDSSNGGETRGWHDQWRLYLRKPAGREASDEGRVI